MRSVLRPNRVRPSTFVNNEERPKGTPNKHSIHKRINYLSLIGYTTVISFLVDYIYDTLCVSEVNNFKENAFNFKLLFMHPHNFRGYECKRALQFDGVLH